MGNSKISISPKTTHRGAIRAKIWASGMYVCKCVPLTLNMSRSFFGVIWCTFLKKGRNSKMAHRRMKRGKNWVSGMYVACTLVFFILNMSGAFRGHSVYFSQIGL